MFNGVKSVTRFYKCKCERKCLDLDRLFAISSAMKTGHRPSTEMISRKNVCMDWIKQAWDSVQRQGFVNTIINLKDP
jgi:hypothetical protein